MGQGGRLVYIYMYNLVDERCSQIKRATQRNGRTTRSLPFLLQDRLQGFLDSTDTSEHIRFYFLVFFHYLVFGFVLIC